MRELSEMAVGMTRTRLDVSWKQDNARDTFSTPIRNLSRDETPSIYNRLSPQATPSSQRQLRCPHCDSIIYCRRNKLCGVCSNVLPDKLLFSPSEAQRIELLLNKERQKHKRWMIKASEPIVVAPFLD